MRAHLYRQEALDEPNLLGSGVPIILPRAQRSAAMLALISIVSLVGWMCTASYTRRVTAQGVLEPRGGLAQIRPSRPGKIAKVHIAAGQHVKAGTPLFTLTADQETQQHGDNLAARLVQLKNDQTRLGGELVVARQSFEEQRRALSGELVTARSRAARLTTQRSLQVEKVAIKQDVFDRLEPLLSKGYVSSLQYKETETELLQAKFDLESVSNQQQDARQTEATLTSRLKRLSDDLAEKSGPIKDRLSNVKQAILQADADSALLIKAPIDGEVTNIVVAEGSGISTSETLATLVPDGSELIVRLIVDSGSIGFIRVGTPVAVRYRSFPYEKFGTQRATVFRTPGAAIATQQDTGMPTSGLAKPIYRVDAEIPHQSINVYGVQEPLKAGMEVTADLMLDRRRIVEWLFEPLIGMRKRMESQEANQ
jgi:membrane fusion protein